MYSDFGHSGGSGISKKKKKLADKILPQKVRDLVPESQAYMDLLAFERKLDSTIMRKRLDIQVRYLPIANSYSNTNSCSRFSCVFFRKL